MESSHSTPTNPALAPEPSQTPGQTPAPFSGPKIGLALGGGGIRAFIYVGIYEVLKENNIPISMVTGTSMGSIIGAAIALGYSPEKIKEFAETLEIMMGNMLELEGLSTTSSSESS